MSDTENPATYGVDPAAYICEWCEEETADGFSRTDGDWVPTCEGCREAPPRTPPMPPYGTPVVARHDIERFPHFTIPAGAHGVYAAGDVVMSDPVPGLEHWENAFIITQDDCEEGETLAAMFWRVFRPA